MYCCPASSVEEGDLLRLPVCLDEGFPSSAARIGQDGLFPPCWPQGRKSIGSETQKQRRPIRSAGAASAAGNFQTLVPERILIGTRQPGNTGYAPTQSLLRLEPTLIPPWHQLVYVEQAVQVIKLVLHDSSKPSGRLE